MKIARLFPAANGNAPRERMPERRSLDEYASLIATFEERWFWASLVVEIEKAAHQVAREWSQQA